MQPHFTFLKTKIITKQNYISHSSGHVGKEQRLDYNLNGINLACILYRIYIYIDYFNHEQAHIINIRLDSFSE